MDGIYGFLPCLKFLKNNSDCLQPKPHKSYLHTLKSHTNLKPWWGSSANNNHLRGKIGCSTSLTTQKDVRKMTVSFRVNSVLHTRADKAHATSIFWSTVLFIPRVTILCVLGSSHSFYRRQKTGMARANLIFQNEFICLLFMLYMILDVPWHLITMILYRYFVMNTNGTNIVKYILLISLPC